MSLKDHKVDTAVDYSGRDISGLDDVPLLSPRQLKQRFDSLVKDVVVPRYNKLIDELGEPAHLVSGGTEGNLAALDGNGDLCDSGVALSSVEKGRVRGKISGVGEDLWYRIAAFHIPAYISDGRCFRIEGYSSSPGLEGRGHWGLELTLTNLGNAYRKVCSLVFADKGITPEMFDLRELDSGEFELWFRPVEQTCYELFLREDGETEPGWAELLTDEPGEPQGETVASVYFAGMGIRLGSVRAAVTAASTYTDVEMSGARVGAPVVVTASDPVPKAVPRSALCVQGGYIRVFWSVPPEEDVTVGLGVVYGV